MITNISIHAEARVPGVMRSWACPVEFDLGGQRMQTKWEFNDSPGTPEEIAEILRAQILRVLAESGFQLLP